MSFESKVLIFELKKSMFVFILLSISLQIFVNGQLRPFKSDSFQDLDFDNLNLQNLRAEANGTAQVEKLFRLPNDVKPTLYTLKMIPDLFGNFSFSGEADIDMKVQNPTSTIFLHTYQLGIKSVDVFRNKRKMDSNYTISLADQIMIIQTKQKLFRNSDVIVSIKFNGSLNDEMTGLYRSSYKVGNTTKWLAITQFESCYARWAFPCFDEPAFRAPFRISVARYPFQKAISNMPLNTTSGLDQSIGNRVWDHFLVTPPMPTYLVAFGVSEFNYRTNAAGVVRVWARENAMDDTAYPLIQSVSAVRNMEAFVGVPYSLPKLDVVAVPDFKAGAMENWGLTTYREVVSLFNPKLGDERSKEMVTTVIAHEFSHQWFGDSVTLAWWDYVWLNEGFARYFQYFLTDMVEPSWRMNEVFVVEVAHSALSADGIFAHSAMNSKVTSLQSIRLKFDVISYCKAASVIRMIEHMVSTITFKKALKLYQISRKNGIAEPKDLYEAFEEVLENEGKSFPNKVSLTTVFQKFADQPGYPCILVSRQRVVDRYTINIKQVPYKSPRSSQNITDKTWVVPLTCTKQSQPEFNNTQPTMWLVDENKIFLPNEVKKDEWYICNIQQSGYYRVNYDAENWELLIKQLHSSHLIIHQLNRAQLINDACTFVKDGFLPHSKMFDLLSYLAHETDPIPWYTGVAQLTQLIRKHADSKASKELLHFTKHLVGHYYSHIGFYEKPDDPHTVKIVRSHLLFLACEMDMEDPVAKAHSEFSSKATNLSLIPAYLKDTVLCIAMKTSSNLSLWNTTWDLFRNSNYEFEKRNILYAFGCAKNDTFLKKYIHKLLDHDDHDIRKQDEMTAFISITRFPRGVLAMINYVHDILPMVENSTSKYDMVMKLLSQIMGRVQSPEQIHRLEHVIEEAEKLNQQKFGKLKETLLKIKENAMKLKAGIDEEAEKIFAVLTGPGPSTPKPSSASILVPHIVMFMITILSVLKLNI